MELFFAALISGLATAFVIGLIEVLLDGFLRTRWIRVVFTLPLSGYGLWLLSPVDWPRLAVAALCSAFIALAVIMLTRRPEVQVVSGRRR